MQQYTYTCQYQIGQEVYYLTNQNHIKYYFSKGTVSSIKFNRTNIYIEIQVKENNRNSWFSTDILDVFETLEEVEKYGEKRAKLYIANKLDASYIGYSEYRLL